jgi:hypothetical protein
MLPDDGRPKELEQNPDALLHVGYWGWPDLVSLTLGVSFIKG